VAVRMTRASYNWKNWEKRNRWKEFGEKKKSQILKTENSIKMKI
jgi:hypothetical protein